MKPAAINKTWHKAVMTKARLKHMHDKCPTKANWEKYRFQRNQCAKLKRKSVRCYFSERCGNDSNLCDFYKTVRPFYTNKGMGSSYHIQLLENNEIISDPKEVANVMNANFVTMADSIGRCVERATLDLGDKKFIENSINKHSNHPGIKLIHKHPEHHNNVSFKHLNPSEVGTILSKLNTKTETGCNGLTAKVIKIAAPAISAPLSGIINHVFDQSKFTTQAKAVEVGPIHKKVSQLDKNNYRPVSVLTILSKMIESSMNEQLSQFYEVVLSALMSAYIKGYSCQYTLIKLCEELRRALDDGKVTESNIW